MKKGDAKRFGLPESPGGKDDKEKNLFSEMSITSESGLQRPQSQNILRLLGEPA